jgi:anaerobic selenocysteine-containing dehydrogenase
MRFLDNVSRRDFVKISGATAISTVILSKFPELFEPITLDAKDDSREYTSTPADKKIYSTCGMCPVHCNIVARVRNDRLVKIDPDKRSPHNMGSLCARGQAGVSMLYDPDRLKNPLKRVGERGEGRFISISWEEALDEIAERLKVYVDDGHPEHLAIYAKPSPLFGLLSRFAKAYGTPNLFMHASVCPGTYIVVTRWTLGAPGFLSMNPDFENSKYILIMGRNYAEGIQIYRTKRLMEAKSQGAKIVVVDPRLSNLAASADVWIPIKPGTDAALLLAIMREIMYNDRYDYEFLSKYTNAPVLIRLDTGLPIRAGEVKGLSGEDFVTWSVDTDAPQALSSSVNPQLEGEFEIELHDGGRVKCKTAFTLLKERVARYTPQYTANICGVSSDIISDVAYEFSVTRPALVDDGWKWVNWSNGSITLRSVYVLNMLIGNIDKPGGLLYTRRMKTGSLPSPPKSFPTINIKPVDRSSDRPIAAPMPHRLFHNAILEGKPYPVKALITHYVGALTNLPYFSKTVKAMKKLDLVVVIDIYPSDTAMYADYVLPESTYLEKEGLVVVGACGEPHVSVMQPVVKPLYDTKPGSYIVKELAKRLGLGEYFDFTPHEVYNNILSPVGITYDQLKKNGFYHITPEKKYMEIPYNKNPPLKLPSGRLEFYCTKFAEISGSIGMDPLDVALPNYIPPKNTPVAEDEFYLLNGKSAIHTFATTQNNPLLFSIFPENELWMNNIRASRLGIRDGDKVIIESLATGEKTLAIARVTPSIHPDAVFTYYGFGKISHYYSKAYNKGFSTTELLGVHEDPISGGVGLNESIVKVYKG